MALPDLADDTRSAWQRAFTLPEARVITLEDTGHLSVLERPEAWGWIFIEAAKDRRARSRDAVLASGMEALP